ncbi:MAG: nucleoside phosphorylase [Lachnospiraceae bacterium]|nr:nucleoside phosphorylase [Lachnospiraceae bacterium]
MILSEFDENKKAIINPEDWIKDEIRVKGEIPKIAVSCFEGKTFERLVKILGGEVIAVTRNANEEFPIYKVKYKDKEIALYMADMGAAGAGGQLEEIIALGVEKFIIFGSCGVLDENIEDCSIIIPNSAVRDEGLSYHYVKPSDEIEVNTKYISEFTSLLDEVKCNYRIGKVWTTDAFYRETKTKMERRKEMGCICVDMECSALAAVAQFREKDIFQFFYTADCLEGDKWDKRSLSGDVKFEEKDLYANLAMELAVRISE